jgi:hypothetical protein
MKKLMVSSLLVIALSLGLVQPAFAATVDLNVHNNTEETVKIVLTGPKNYSFDVQPGKILKTVEEGKYKYSYGACGEKFSGEITVEDDNQWLVVEPCGELAIFSKFVVDSHLDAVTLKLSGPQNYDLAVTLGSNKFISLQVGDYAYSYDACGGTWTGTLSVLKNGTGRITLYSCEQANFRNLAANVDESASNLRIGSHYAFPVRLSLFGQVNYSFEIVPGLNRLNVLRGQYSYSYVAYGQTRTGTINVTEAGVSIIISPLR